MTETAAPISAEEAATRAGAIREAVARVMKGQTEVVDGVLVSFLAGGHVLLEGLPGLGKTLLVLALSRAVSGKFSRIQFTPDLMPSDVTGHAVFDRQTERFRIRQGPVFSNLLLADEINRAPAKTQAALLEVMQEGQATIEGESLPMPSPFMTLATQNPIEHEGTYPLPDAQLDRFLLKLVIDYPVHEEELDIVRGVTQGRVGNKLDVSQIAPVVTLEGAAQLQRAAANVLVDDKVLDYAVRLVRATRERRGLRLGAGPRGGIALVRAARAAALLAGRDFVTPDDVKRIALPALRHRVTLAPELEIEGTRVDDVLRATVEAVEAPRS